ncbi:MAG: alpha/beta hydrolase [Actinomycetota bacterium]
MTGPDSDGVPTVPLAPDIPAAVALDGEVKLLPSVDGELVALHDLGGDGPGPPLLLSHGNGLNVGMWAAALPLLRERFRCFGLDLRGHGRSRPSGPGYSVARADLAGDVATAVAAIGEPVRFAGHSLGAASAVLAAVEDIDRFTGLWLFEPVIAPIDLDLGDGPIQLIEISRRRRMDFDSVEDAIERFSSKPPYAGCHPAAVRGYVEIGTVPTATGVRLSCSGEDEARGFEEREQYDLSRFAVIDRPTVVAAGGRADEPNTIPRLLADHVVGAIPGARLELFAGMTHFGPMEQPEVAARSVIELFGTIGS